MKTCMNRVLIVLAAMLIVGFALAQGPRFTEAPRSGMTARMQSERDAEPEFAPRGQHGPSRLGERMRGVLHETLGLSEDEIHARKEAGQSIAGIAEDLGIARETLEDAYLVAREEAIEQLLEEGRVAELQAQRMTDRGPEVFATVVDRAGLGGGQHATGETLNAQRAEAPRGPQTEPVHRHQMEPMQRGPHGQRTN